MERSFHLNHLDLNESRFPPHRGQARRAPRRVHHKCDRKGRYSAAKLIEKCGRKGNMMKWREMLNADCPKRDAAGLRDRCDVV